MKVIQASSGFLPSNYDVFSGLDVDKKSISATFLEHNGNMRAIRIPHDVKNLIGYVTHHYFGQRVAFAYEAGPTGFGLYDELTKHGYFCLITSPSNIPTAKGQRVKTNRLDSQKISLNLRGGQLKPVHVPTETYRHLRHLTQLRDTFVKQMKATKYRIKSLLLYEGIPFPQAPPSSQWSSKVISQLQVLDCSLPVRFKLDRLLVSLRFFHSNVLETTRAIRLFCRSHDELSRNIGYLMSIPGIGWVTSSQLLARIGDWRQLGRVEELGSFLGLVPSEKSTGDEVHRGSITRLGDNHLRNKLIQCAWISIRRDPQLREFYRRIFKRHHGKYAARKAIVAVARKLTTRIFAVLSEQRNYQIRQTINSVPLTPEEITLSREETRPAPEQTSKDENHD
jgi:transposase